jgi:hypothetical protein
MMEGDKKIISLNVYASEKFEQWNFMCMTEEERAKWADVFLEGIKGVPIEAAKDFDRILSKKGATVKKPKGIARTDVHISFVLF